MIPLIKEPLPNRLRRTIEAIANTPSHVGMDLWNDHSNAVLEAANILERQNTSDGVYALAIVRGLRSQLATLSQSTPPTET